MPNRNELRALAEYEVSADRGFLSSFQPADIALPEPLNIIQAAALALPHTLPSGRIRKILDALPEVASSVLKFELTDAQKRVAMVHYSFLVQSYVWGEKTAPEKLPANLARPIWTLAEETGQMPLLPYTSYVLDNWGLIDPNDAFTADNIYMIQPFLGGQDEAWFVIIHVAIEARAGEMLAAIPDIFNTVEENDSEALEKILQNISAVWDDINAIFDRMPERCDPYIYYSRVRPWIHGWKDNPALGEGLVYEGVESTRGTPQAFRGQTGSQSSIVPTMDALFGIKHASDPMRAYLDELHAYRPPAHRMLIEDVREHSKLREFVLKAGTDSLTCAYNDCIAKLAQFRTKHLEYAASYINKQAKTSDGNHTDIGTGGTPFMRYLKKHRDEVQQQLISSLLKTG